VVVSVRGFHVSGGCPFSAPVWTCTWSSMGRTTAVPGLAKDSHSLCVCCIALRGRPRLYVEVWPCHVSHWDAFVILTATPFCTLQGRVGLTRRAIHQGCLVESRTAVGRSTTMRCRRRRLHRFLCCTFYSTPQLWAVHMHRRMCVLLLPLAVPCIG